MSRLDIGPFRADAFSGDGKHRNKRSSMCLKDEGSIPYGLYYIVDRESGGRLGKLRDLRSGKSDWFALYANDGFLDDVTFCNNVERGQFRLHPKGILGISQGCIVIDKPHEYTNLRNFLLLHKHKIPGKDIITYGTIQVI
ncbi:MAG: DUF2778 domain-containing protein [Betaproteobacteria bacterium]|nr:DUF2778 domain-containing protein [Betaproteobacteria bacterium]